MGKFKSRTDLKDFLEKCVRHLTPKSKANASLVLQATVEFQGKIHLIRANAPMNYRAIYWKLHPEDLAAFKTKNEYSFWAERISNNWIKTSDHDSCWDAGLCPQKYFFAQEPEYFTPVDLKKIELCRASLNDGYRVLALAETLPVEKTINFEEKDYLESLVELLKAIYQPVDSLEVEFHAFGDGSKRSQDKSIFVLSSETMKVENSEEILPLTAEEIKKYLKDPDKYLNSTYYLRHSREKTYFS